ncbi:MAG: cell wall anchor protein [Muribaculum sp.]|nr:cell wall anchor protein [Muribaculum sp.]
MKSGINRIIYILSVWLLSLGVSTSAMGPVIVKASLDSAYILMGKQTTLNVSVVQDAGTQGFFANAGDTLTREIEVIRALQPDTTSVGSGREEISQDIIIQSFDSGLYTIRPFVYVAGNDTFKSNELALKVIPVPVDTLQTIHDYAGTSTPGWKIWDFLPDFIVDYWWMIFIFAAIVLLVAIYYVWRQRSVIITTIRPPKPPLPPYELAIQQLNALKNQKLCEHGHEKEYYTRLTEILRNYLQRRYNINAMEMTSSQIISEISSHQDIKPSSALMKQILEIADFVKFANVRPMPDDNIKTFNMAVQFVEATKPVEAAPDTDAKKEEKTEVVKDTKTEK